MSTRGKILLAAVLAAALLVAAGVYVATRLRPAIAAAVEDYGERATGTDVRLGSVDVSLGDSRATLSDLVVGNPRGYTTAYALRIGEISVTIDAPSLARNMIVLHDVVLSDATLNAEQRDASSNLTEILDHMDRAGESSSTESGPMIIIEHFRLAGGRIALTSDALSKAESIDLPEVLVNDIGKAEGGVTLGEATDAVLAPILTAARRAVRERLGDTAEEAAKRKLEDAARKRLRELTQPKD
jgi:uncharacterized protein involved in outer membrane biogenesis